jgi:hypothetical protein
LYEDLYERIYNKVLSSLAKGRSLPADPLELARVEVLEQRDAAEEALTKIAQGWPKISKLTQQFD